MNKAPINVQDSFFYNLRKDNIAITVRFTSGEERMGRLRRFDKFALVLEVDGREEMIYKHAIASIRSESLPPSPCPRRRTSGALRRAPSPRPPTGFLPRRRFGKNTSPVGAAA